MDLSAGERDPVKGADWLEAQAIYSRRGFAHKSDIVGAALEAGDLIDDEDQADHDMPSIADDRSLAATRLADNIEAEVQRREEVCGDAYPFSLVRGRLTWRNPGTWGNPYIVCLLASDREQYRAGDDTARVFEHLTTLALRTFLDGKAVRFGAPRDTMPTPINEALQELALMTYARRIDGWPVLATDQDMGLDVVGWKDFADRHNNLLQIYAQCATGEGWLEEKIGEPNIEMWSGVLLWGLTPITALAVPYVASPDGLWQRRMAGRLLLDRLRIAAALDGVHLEDGPIYWADWAETRASRARID